MRPRYLAETKAAVLAALALGAKMADLAREHGVSRSTVLRWRDESFQSASNSSETKLLRSAYDLEIAEYRLRCAKRTAELLEVGLKSITEQLRNHGDTDYLRTQDASGVAELLGASVDAVLRFAEEVEPDPGGMDAADGAADDGDRGGP